MRKQSQTELLQSTLYLSCKTIDWEIECRGRGKNKSIWLNR